SNTLFVITADEGDHFVGGPPSPANCDGVTIPCTYAQIGELNGNLAGLLATEQGITTPFTVHSDSAPTIYITGNPARDASVTRTFGRALGQVTAVNPMTGNQDPLAVALADPVGMKLLHMITADPARAPTLAMFADPNYFLFAGAPNCNNPCVTEQPGFAWNHGDISEDIARTWLGLVGPGVKRGGGNGHLWSDPPDIRPTMLSLLGLKDDYMHDGRVLVEALHDNVLPRSLHAHSETLIRLAEVYKQINAPFGALGRHALTVSTAAIKSGTSSDDSRYAELSGHIAAWTATRNQLGTQIKALPDAAAFGAD